MKNINNDIMSQLPKEFLDRMREYLQGNEYDLFLQSLNQDEKKGIVLDLYKLADNNLLLNEIIDTLQLKLYYENNNYNYYFFDESYFKDNKTIGNQIYYHQGLYYVQEPSASQVIKNVKINNNDKILDLCAAPGGKSINALFNDKNGFVISNDIDFKRSKIISSNIERLGISNCIVTNNNPTVFQTNFKSYFDKVILDVPCSGEGMMRKNETARLQWNPNLILKMSSIQKQLIDIAYECVKDNGTIIYSTCTFAKEEDEDIIQYITNKHKTIEVLDQKKIYFHDNIGEGQFYAILVKHEQDNNEPSYIDIKNNIINLKYKKSKIYNDFIKVFEKIIDYDITKEDSHLILLNNKIYAIDNNIPLEIIDNLNILRVGIELAEINNNNISLSHSISHSKYANYFKHKIDLSKEDSYKYLKGETFKIDLDIKSFALATYKCIPLGICKITNNTLKNHYPKGLRNLN